MIQTGYMPPWMPSNDAPKFKHDRSLNESDKAAILAWIDEGTPLTVPLDTPLTNQMPSGGEVREDQHLTMAEPYVPTGELLDVYRCFLFDPQLPEGGYVTASNVIPGDRRVVHHVIVFQTGAASRAEAVAKSSEDEQPGWQCFGGTELANDEPGAIGSSLGFWVPGSTAMIVGPALGIYVPPGGLIVLQVHYNYAAGFYPDQTSVVLQVEPADAEIIPLRGLPLLAPVEIPCPANVENAACDRKTALSQRSEDDQAMAARLLKACGKTVNDYTSQSADHVVSSCDWRVPLDGKLMQVGGHMHTRGKSLRIELNPEGPNPIVIQDLPVWDFNWQGSYSLEDPIVLRKGDILRITCTWDNRQRNRLQDARYITWGEGTDDEMCLAVPQVQPAPGFEDVAGRTLLLNMITTLPGWMPAWGRGLLIGLRGALSNTLLFGSLAFIAVGTTLIYGVRIRYQANQKRARGYVNDSK